MWRLRPPVLSAAVWAIFGVIVVRRRLKVDGVRARAPRSPRWLPASAGVGVDAVVARLRPTCIEGALIGQAWLERHSEPLDVVVGVLLEGMQAGPAHAWLDGRDPASAARHVEIHRIPPRTFAA